MRLMNSMQKSNQSYQVAAAATSAFSSLGGAPERRKDADDCKHFKDSTTKRYSVAGTDSILEASSNLAAIRKRIADMQLSGDGDDDDDGG